MLDGLRAGVASAKLVAALVVVSDGDDERTCPPCDCSGVVPFERGVSTSLEMVGTSAVGIRGVSWFASVTSAFVAPFVEGIAV